MADEYILASLSVSDAFVSAGQVIPYDNVIASAGGLGVSAGVFSGLDAGGVYDLDHGPYTNANASTYEASMRWSAGGLVGSTGYVTSLRGTSFNNSGNCPARALVTGVTGAELQWVAATASTQAVGATPMPAIATWAFIRRRDLASAAREYLFAGMSVSQLLTVADQVIAFDQEHEASGISLNTGTSEFTLTEGKTYLIKSQHSERDFTNDAHGYTWKTSNSGTEIATGCHGYALTSGSVTFGVGVEYQPMSMAIWTAPAAPENVIRCVTTFTDSPNSAIYNLGSYVFIEELL